MQYMLVRSVWLNGTVGSGKTTIGEVLAEHLANTGEAVAFVNIDDLGTAWPRPADDPFNVAVVTQNLGALVSNYQAAGARTVVVAGVVQTQDQLDRYASVLGIAPQLVRLVAPPDEVERRLRVRHEVWDHAGLRWHLARAPELEDLLDDADLSMTVVENRGSPLETAQAVLSAIGWPVVTPS